VTAIMTSQTPQLLFAAGSAVVLGGAFLVILRAGKTLRSQLGLPDTSPKPGTRRRPSGPAPITRDAYSMGKKLKAQGLPGTEALAAMSPAERQFFLEAVSARVGDGTGPRLVRGNAEPSPQPTASATPDALPEAALVTAPIHCPVCRTEIGRRTDPGITMKKCPGCSRRVGARVEGDRLIVTVNYGLRS
jgi:hypothetical protein